MFVNLSSSNLTLGTPNITSGTVQSAVSVPPKTNPPGINAFFARSSSDSTSGASGFAKWTVDDDGVVCNVYYNAPNTGDPAGLPTLDGVNAGNYTFVKGPITCSGDGCDINSGNRNYTMTVTLTRK
jgi:hypothetical protein